MSYELFVEPQVHGARRDLPGNVRQRIRRAIAELAHETRPDNSDELDVADLSLPAGVEIRRIRLERWRLIYAVHDTEQWVWVLGLYRRPPYDYQDLIDLIGKLR